MTIFSKGSELRERREAMGLSVSDVCDQIHIRCGFIHAIEDGDLAALPEACYVIGFLKSYCALLELDSAAFIENYRVATLPPMRILGIPTEPREWRNPPRWLSDVGTWAAVMLLLAAGWAAYTYLFQPASHDGEGRVEATTHEIVAPAPLEGFSE